MPPIMENKLYGSNKISYQDLGEARLIIKHSQPINTDYAAGRSQHIQNIYIENVEGERFKYPYKHILRNIRRLRVQQVCRKTGGHDVRLSLPLNTH